MMDVLFPSKRDLSGKGFPCNQSNLELTLDSRYILLFLCLPLRALRTAWGHAGMAGLPVERQFLLEAEAAGAKLESGQGGQVPEMPP